MRKNISSYHPWLYKARVKQRQIHQELKWKLGSEKFALTVSDEKLPWKIYRHQSKLKRYFTSNPVEDAWQDNKVHNHSIAISHINNVIIKPGETLSFWKLVGKPSAARGFKEGMELSQGRAQGGVGGGICQIANLLHWLALHSPLQVTKRANHSFDPFPDQGRVIPYGTGAALFYNYIDIWLYNPTDANFQLRIWMDDKLLHGEFRSDQLLPHQYHVYEKNGHFTEDNGIWFRHNEIWRDMIEKGQQKTLLETKKLYENHVKVLYTPR